MPTDHDDVTMRIAIAWRDLRRVRSRPLSAALPQGQLDTLDVMSQRGPCSMVELSAALRIDASTATRAVDRLVETDLASRRRSDEDARTVMVELTATGRRLVRRLTTERIAYLEGVLHDLSATDRRQVAESLETLVAAADAYEAEDRSSATG